MSESQGQKKPLSIIACIICLLVCGVYVARVYKEESAKAAAIDDHNKLVADVNQCIEAGEWTCAENAARTLLKETPSDTNLQVILAALLMEQGRYDECIEYVDGLNFHSDMAVNAKQKSIQLKKEMEELGIENSMHFRVEFDGRPSRGDVLEALTVLEVAFDSISDLFDYIPEDRLQLVLHQSDNYQGTGPRPDWVGAVFDGKLRVPIEMMQNREVYRPMIFHELTHAFIRSMSRFKVPIWLNEGLAQTVDGSRTTMPRPYGPKPSLEALTSSFVEEKKSESAELLYWYSQRMVEELFRVKGGSVEKPADFIKMRDCIRDFRTLSVEAALKKHYGVTEKQLWERVK